MIIKKIDWSEEREPNEWCHYPHVTGASGLGGFLISWKSWEEYPIYTIEIDRNFITQKRSLNAAKKAAQAWLEKVVMSCLEVAE